MLSFALHVAIFGSANIHVMVEQFSASDLCSDGRVVRAWVRIPTATVVLVSQLVLLEGKTKICLDRVFTCIYLKVILEGESTGLAHKFIRLHVHVCFCNKFKFKDDKKTKQSICQFCQVHVDVV